MRRHHNPAIVTLIAALTVAALAPAPARAGILAAPGASSPVGGASSDLKGIAGPRPLPTPGGGSIGKLPAPKPRVIDLALPGNRDRTIVANESGPRDVIVELDARLVRNFTDSIRRSKNLTFDDAPIRAAKKTGYRNLRKAFVAGISPLGIEVVRTFDNLPLVVVHVDGDAQVRALEARADVQAVHENLYFSPTLVQSLPQVGQPAAAARGATGTGATVAVLDTGVDFTRAAFGNCTAPGQPAGCRVAAAAELADDDGSRDDDGHGTNVAAIVLGMAPGARVLALDVFDRTFGRNLTNVVGLAAAIDFVIATKFQFNTVAMNLSLGTDGAGSIGRCLSPVDPLFLEAQAVGVMPIVAAGNDGQANRTSIPACSPFAVSVGAVTEANQVATFSNSSSTLDLLAPGTNITAAGITMSGTSQATPHVAGAWAVLRAARPTLDLSQTLQALVDTGTPVIDPRQGRVVRRIRIDAALNWQARVVPPIGFLNLGDLAPITIDWVNCQTQQVADGLACGYEQVVDTVTDAVECGVRQVTSAAQCGMDTITSAARCGVDLITGSLDTLADILAGDFPCSCSGFSCTCEVPATCQVPATCNVANTCSILRDCDPNDEDCDARTCSVAVCGF